MANPRPVRLRISTKCLSALAAVSAIVLALSAFVNGGGPVTPTCGLGMDRGAIVVVQFIGVPGNPLAPEWRSRLPWPPTLTRWRPERQSLRFSASSSINTVIVPLWIPFLALAIPAFILIRLDRRRFAPGRCERCGYDLAGLAPGAACPECGGARR